MIIQRELKKNDIMYLKCKNTEIHTYHLSFQVKKLQDVPQVTCETFQRRQNHHLGP